MDLTKILGTEPVTDAEEEAFVIFSQDIPSRSLGFIDSSAATLELNVAGYDLNIHQSRGLLTSDRKQGTTGAVLWTITPLLATWLCHPTNFLFTHSLLHPSSTALELGAGVSGIVALTLGSRIASYTATDQAYVLKLLRQNIAENLDVVLPSVSSTTAGKRRKNDATKQKGSGGKGSGSAVVGGERIRAEPLDWETDDVSQWQDVDLIIACDCIYNEALIEPLNATCAALCRLRQSASEKTGGIPTLCLIAQQLRSPDVFEAWLKSFCRLFHVWRVPDEMLLEGLREGSGFVVHVGVVR